MEFFAGFLDRLLHSSNTFEQNWAKCIRVWMDFCFIHKNPMTLEYLCFPILCQWYGTSLFPYFVLAWKYFHTEYLNEAIAQKDFGLSNFWKPLLWGISWVSSLIILQRSGLRSSHRRCFMKNVFLIISQNSQENLRNSKEHLFYRTPLSDWFWVFSYYSNKNGNLHGLDTWDL